MSRAAGWIVLDTPLMFEIPTTKILDRNEKHINTELRKGNSDHQ
jgi:hypothetical protein